MTDGVKKGIIWFFILIGIFLFMVFSVAVIMMLSPGLEIFGIKYVSAKIGKYNHTEQIILNKDIVIESDSVPVNIYFGGTTAGIEYVQEFQGFTMSSNVPGIKLENSQGQTYDSSRDSAVYIKISQYKKFIWANSMKDFYINIGLPTTYSTNHTIQVKSNSSAVNLKGGTQTLQSLDIDTSGPISFQNTMTISGNLKIKSNNSVEIPSSVNINGSVVANVGGNLTIKNAITGDIQYTTSGGNLKINTCKNLTVVSSSGSIKNPTSGQISGNLNFETSSGSVEITTIAGTSNKITSKSGTIDIESCGGTLNITTSRAKINVGTVQNLVVETNTGDLSANKVTNNLTVATVTGDISIAQSVGGKADVKTKSGKITFAEDISGDLKVVSNSGKIYMVSCENLNAQLGDGGLYYSKDTGNGIVVNGKAEIESNRGEINIYSVNGSTNKVKTKYGNINVKQCATSLDIESYDGSINIVTVSQVKIRATYSVVNINNSTSSADIQTAGDITMGKDGVVAGLAKVYSFNGILKLYNTTGAIYAYSDNHIEMHNNSSTTIYLNKAENNGTGAKNYKGSVYAEGLRGNVNVYSKDAVELKFAVISGNVNVETTGTEKAVKIEAKNTSYTTVNYELQCQRGKACHVYWGNEAGANDGKSTIKNNNSSANTIKVLTEYAPITLYLKSL